MLISAGVLIKVLLIKIVKNRKKWKSTSYCRFWGDDGQTWIAFGESGLVVQTLLGPRPGFGIQLVTRLPVTFRFYKYQTQWLTLVWWCCPLDRCPKLAVKQPSSRKKKKSIKTEIAIKCHQLMYLELNIKCHQLMYLELNLSENFLIYKKALVRHSKTVKIVRIKLTLRSLWDTFRNNPS